MNSSLLLQSNIAVCSMISQLFWCWAPSDNIPKQPEFSCFQILQQNILRLQNLTSFLRGKKNHMLSFNVIGNFKTNNMIKKDPTNTNDNSREKWCFCLQRHILKIVSSYEHCSFVLSYRRHRPELIVTLRHQVLFCFQSL